MSPYSNERDQDYLVTDLSGAGQMVASKPFYGEIDDWKRNYSATIAQLVIMARGAMYEKLHQIQCGGVMMPITFKMHVDTVDRTINVVPSDKPAINIDGTGAVAFAAIDTFATMSLISTTSFTSLNGDILMSNVRNVHQARMPTTPSSALYQNADEDLSSEDYLAGVSAALQALADQTSLQLRRCAARHC